MRSAESVGPGVPVWMSRPILLDLAPDARLPRIDGCLGLRLVFPRGRTELSILGMLVSPVSSARFESTLLDLALEAGRPRMLG